MAGLLGMLHREDTHPYIPTKGLPGTALDFYRAAYLVTDDYIAENPGLIDYRKCKDLGIFEDEISSFSQILKFEELIRFVLLHDRIDVLTPSVKYFDKSSSMESYVRTAEIRNDSSLLILNAAGAHDLLLPSEKITIEQNRVTGSTFASSSFLGRSRESLADLVADDPAQQQLFKTLPASVSVPFVDYSLESSDNFSVIYQSYIDSMSSEWTRQTDFAVKAGYKIPLPFFTNSVLSIAKNREDIPNAVVNLRGDLRGLREQLFSFLKELRNINSPLQQAALQKEIETTVATYSRRIFSSSNFVSDMVRFLVDVAKQPAEAVAHAFNPQFELKNKYPVMFGNGNYKRLRKLLTLDNVNTNITNFLTIAEIDRLRKG